MSLNKMMIIGNLGADPELRYTPSGKAVTNLRVAVNSNRRGPDGEWVEETLWLRVEVWDQAAERAAEQLRKGNKVYAEGELRRRRGKRRARNGAPAGRAQPPRRRRDGRRRHPVLIRGKSHHAEPPLAARVRGLLPRSASPQGLQLLRRQGREHRLQGGQSPAPIPVGAGEDRATSQDGNVRAPPAHADHRAQACPPRGAAAVCPAAPAPLDPVRSSPASFSLSSRAVREVRAWTSSFCWRRSASSCSPPSCSPTGSSGSGTG